MPGPAHETLVTLLHQHPELIDRVLRTLGLPGLAESLTAQDSTLRVANPLEVRPDLVFSVGTGRRWLIVEVQLAEDDAKRRRWIAGAAVLFDTHGAMGDVLVFTHEASVAEWAAQVAHVNGPLGTKLALTPVVVRLTRAEVDVLLATGRPELAVFAAWAVHDQRGRDAQEVVRAAAERIESEPDPELRETLARAMISMLGDPLVAVLKEMWMKPLTFPESPALKELREMLEARGELRGEARGELRAAAQMVLRALAVRGLAVDNATRERVMACNDRALIDRWFERAVTTATVREVFADDPPSA